MRNSGTLGSLKIDHHCRGSGLFLSVSQSPREFETLGFLAHLLLHIYPKMFLFEGISSFSSWFVVEANNSFFPLIRWQFPSPLLVLTLADFCWISPVQHSSTNKVYYDSKQVRAWSAWQWFPPFWTPQTKNSTRDRTGQSRAEVNMTRSRTRPSW